MSSLLLLAALLAGPDDLPRSLAQQEPPATPVPKPEGKGSPVIDWDWLEVQPRLGVVFFSEDYESDPSWSAGIHARAPLPWLSPGTDPGGDYFGVFAEVAFAGIDRDLDPAPEDTKGVLTLAAAGLDFTLLRNSTWLFLLHGGFQYISFGGVSDLDDGFGALAGVTEGLTLAEGVSLTLSQEVWFGNAGDRLYLTSLGALIHF